MQAARSWSCGPPRFFYEWWLLYLDAAEVAAAFEVEGLETVDGLCAAVAVDAGEGGVDVVLDADAFVHTDFDAAEAAVEDDGCAVHDVGATPVEAAESKACMYFGAFKRLTAVAVFLLAEGDVDFVHFAAVEDDGSGRLAVVAVAAALLVVEEQE